MKISRRTLHLVFLASILMMASAHAGSATWDLNPATNDWNSAANWTPATVPNGTSDVATFGVSNVIDPTFSAPTSLGGIVFNAGASAFTIAFGHGRTLNFYGAGITNNSGVAQTFAADVFRDSIPQIVFHNSSTAGDGTVFAINAPSNLMGLLFLDSSSAGSSTINLAGGSDVFGSSASFNNDSTAANASINVNGGLTSGAQGADLAFFDNFTADHATITAHGGAVAGAGGGLAVFATSGSPTAGAATLVADGSVAGADGGFFEFLGTSDGGTAQVELTGNGTLDVSGLSNPAMNIGSLEGNGIVSLGQVDLSVGSNSLSTVFSGLIQNGTTDGSGSLTKVGADTSLGLSGANTYTGGTFVTAGSLIVSNTTGSATGTGPVQVNGGTLGGSGTINGKVTVNAGASLAPAGGTNKQATLTIKSALTFNSGSTYGYTFKAKSNKFRTDEVLANGVTIASGATFNLRGQVQGHLLAGVVFTVISNTSAGAINGTFSNLPDGGTITVGSTNFQANYEGGSGNDLTLTVVP